jgi:hypothetical protein
MQPTLSKTVYIDVVQFVRRVFRFSAFSGPRVQQSAKGFQSKRPIRAFAQGYVSNNRQVISSVILNKIDCPFVCG